MNGRRETCWRARLGAALLAVALGVGCWIAAPTPAAAQFPFGFGVPYPRFYAPVPYYPPPAYYPYYPPGYYAPPAPGYYPPPAPAAAPAPASNAAITYTKRPAFTNTAGQTCREYTTTQDVSGRSTLTYGTACRDASGQWRVAN